jgi:HEPN domain-containing protein
MKQKNKKNPQLAKEWFLRAQDDELSIKDILEDRQGSPNTVCFLSQQMAEKYLKGFLVFHRKRFPKIHHLDKLLNLAKKIDDQFENLRKEAEELSEFYITTRYPGDYPQFTFKDAEKAFKGALKIKEFILRKTKLL